MDIHELFSSMTYSTIEDYVSQRQQEGLHLEFKAIGDAALTSRDDRKNLAKAMSGFANSSGGIVVWGVDARKNADGVDCATSLLDIENVEALISRLNQLTGQAADPIVPGVLHRSFVNTNGRGSRRQSCQRVMLVRTWQSSGKIDTTSEVVIASM